MTPLVLRAILLLGIWLLVLGDVKPLDLVLGAVVAGAAVIVPRPGPEIRRGDLALLGRIAAAPRFLAAVLLEVVRGTWDVSLRVLHLRGLERPGFVEVPLGERTQLGTAVSALVTTLSPGSVLVEIDQDRRTMLLHVMDASDPDRVREHHQRFYDLAQKRVFP